MVEYFFLCRSRDCPEFTEGSLTVSIVALAKMDLVRKNYIPCRIWMFVRGSVHNHRWLVNSPLGISSQTIPSANRHRPSSEEGMKKSHRKGAIYSAISLMDRICTEFEGMVSLRVIPEYSLLAKYRRGSGCYNATMRNWSTDISRLRQNPSEFERFSLEQMINFGLNGRKLSLRMLKKHWDTLRIDPKKRAFLQKIVWPQS